jgi:DNA modification methylase
MIVVCQVPGGDAINNIQLGRFGRNRTNVWTHPGVNTFMTGPNDDYALHPTVKPVAMIAEAIKDASPRGGIVLDPFLGSGTTLLACEKVGRRCSGVEYEPSYVDVAIRRWQQYTGQDAVLVSQDKDETGPGDLVGLTYDEVAAQRLAVADAGPVNDAYAREDSDTEEDRP